MFDLVLDNLPIVIFALIALAARVLQSRARAAARQKKESPPVFASTLEPDEDDGEVTFRHEPDEDEAFIDYAQTRGASASVREKAQALLKLAEDQPRPAGFDKAVDKPLVPAPPRAADSASPEEKNQVSPLAAVEKQKPLNGFRYKLKNLSPLQGAIAWAEILGKPKGMV
jgi:hypothetical protein